MARTSLVLLGLLGAAAAQSLPARVTNNRGCSGYGQPCTILLQEGLDVMATFTLDEPIVCQSNDNFECSVVINISNSHPHIVAVEPCFVRWDRTEWHQSRQVRITAVQNYRDVPGEQHQIHLNAQVLSLASYYNNYPVEGFFIETTNRRTAQCRSTGDPHYSTFDGKYWHYYRASTTTLYRAPNRDFAVQTRTTGYPGRNCGIAGRENRDRVIIDNCGGGLRIQTNFHSTNPEVHPRVQVSGNTYTVYFYSGAWFRAQVNGWGMNVYTASVDATPSNAPSGHEYSCGLCGNFNGNRNDDVPGYRITSYAPLFPCMKVPSIATRPRDGVTVSFGNIWNWVYNEADFTSLPVIVPLPQVNCPYTFQRIVRPIINTDDVEDITNALRDLADNANGDDGFGFTFGGNDGNITTAPDFPLNLSAIACQNNIDQSLTVQRCAQLYASFNLSLANYTEDCAEDYGHAGGPGVVGDAFLAAALRALEAECLALAVQNNDTSLLTLQQVLCDNACSGRGNCTQGARCVCPADFGGSDCSIDLNAPPVIVGASDVVYDSAGLQRNHTPREIVVTGTNFLASANLTCRFNTTLSQALYIGPTQILCAVPVLIHRGPTPLHVPLQVSNDGVLFSNATNARFIYYDGTCQACNASGFCGPNPSTCIIDGQCYLPHAQQPATANSTTNPCRLCIPQTSNTDWTYDYTSPVCHPRFTLPIYTEEIVGAAVGGTEILRVDGTANPLVRDDPNYQVTYTYFSNIADPSITQWFNVHPTTGAVTLNRTVNMSDPVFMNMQHAATNPQNFNGFFRVVATDHQGYTSVADVTIDLVPLTVHGAIFPALGFSGVIPENATSGTPVMNHSNPSQPLIISPLPGSNVSVNSYEWFLQPQGATDALRIDPTTGAVTVRNGNLLDYETAPHLNFRVRATVTLQYITPLFVEVTNVDEPPTAIVTTPSDPTVPEGPRTSNVVANLSTIDGDANATSDGGPFTYLLLSGGDVFELREWVAGVSSTTYLAVINDTILDFESGPTSYTVTVRTTDPGGLQFTENITVAVTNVNEAPANVTISALPAGSAPANVVVTQNDGTCTIVAPEDLTVGALVAGLSATDPDAGAARPQCYASDGLGKFSQDAQHQFMLLASTLDYETNATFPVAVTCTDAVDFSLEVTTFCTVTVLDVPEAPLLLTYTYIGGAINETEVRRDDRVVGIITAVDPDATGGGPITFTPPPGYTTSNPTCVTLPTNAVQCTTNLTVLANTTLRFANSTNGIIPVPVVIAQGGLNRTVNVNVTVLDQPELPTGFSITFPGPLFENAPAGTVVAQIVLDDPDSTPQNYTVELVVNPNGAFALEAVDGDVSARWLKVANPAAIDFVEPPLSTRHRRQSNVIGFSFRICEPSNPQLGCVTETSSVTVSDRPLQPVANSSTIAPAFGSAVQFVLQNQDIAALDAHLRWTLNSTTLTSAMGSVALSPTGELTVTSAGGLCQDGGANSFLVFAEYNFDLFPGTLPPGYATTRFQVELTIEASTTLYPFFSGVPSTGFSASVRPVRGSTVVAERTIFVDVRAPCGASLGYTLSVVGAPVPVPLTAALTGAELVRDGNSGFIRPQSLGELQANLQSQVWQRSDLFTMAPTATATSASESFAFSTASLTGAVTTTGTATTLRVQYQPSASPTLPLTDSSLVLLAELASTGRAVTTPLTVQYLDACGVNTAGQQVDPNPCNPGDACVSIFQNSAWDFQCTPPIIVTLPPDNEAATASAGSGGDNLALWIAIILVILIAILIAAVLYFRRQKNAHEEWDGRDDNRSRLPTYHNPTYESAGGVPRTRHDTTFRTGVANAVYEWYRPNMSRKECTEHLMAQGEGSFVVRDSDANVGWHMLGVKTSNRVVHDKIRLTEGGEYELLPSIGEAADTRQPAFKSLPELVDHYLLNGEESGLGYKLVDSNPIYDNHQLVQERTGKAVEAKYEEAEALPEKRQYDSVANVGGDGVSNPMYGRDGGPPPADGYLDVGETATSTDAYEAI